LRIIRKSGFIGKNGLLVVEGNICEWLTLKKPRYLKPFGLRARLAIYGPFPEKLPKGQVGHAQELIDN